MEQLFLVDIGIALLLLYHTWNGYRRGFVLTLCGFLAFFVASIGAYYISGIAAPIMAESITPFIEDTIRSLLEEYLAAGVSDVPMQETAISPDTLLPFLQDGNWGEQIGNYLQQQFLSGLVQSAADAAHSIAVFAAEKISQIVTFVLAFFGISILWSLLSRILNLATRLPVLHTLNRAGGCALGFVKGALLALLVCCILKLTILPQENVGDTFLLRSIYPLLPI